MSAGIATNLLQVQAKSVVQKIIILYGISPYNTGVYPGDYSGTGHCWVQEDIYKIRPLV